jgi:saccharopine dehydrogenase (NAD+, L-lysine-forming)
MFLEELRGLPQAIPSLRKFGFFVGSFNWFTDWFLLPLGMLWYKLAPRSAERVFSRWLLWGLETFTRPPYGTRLKLEAGGLKDGVPHRLELLLSHSDGYFFTAAPAAAALLQWLDGSQRRPGLFAQGEWAEPGRLLADLERMGIEVTRTWA